MTQNILVSMTVVLVFSLVQSLFGVGLLVFGTPTLLLLGYPFDRALSILLPASLGISALQIIDGPLPKRSFIRRFAIWCLAPLVGGLATTLVLDLRVSLDFAVALLLTLFVVLRSAPHLSSSASRVASAHERTWLTMMGAVHGLSNLGGALLVVFATARHEDRYARRAFIAFCYACFAATQLSVLAAITPDVMGLDQLAFASIASVSFVFVGRRLFRSVPTVAFDRMLTWFGAAYAGILWLRVAGLL